jgi:hypothetical protein
LRKPYRIILIVSGVLTALLFWYDAIHDDPDKPYSLAEMLSDIAIAGSMYTAIFWAFFSAVYYLSEKLGKLFKSKPTNK